MKIYKIIAFVMVMLALLLASCGPTATEEPVATEEPAAPSETEEPMEEPVATEEPMGEPLKIGVMSDLTGALALFGNEMWNGLQLGFDYATDGTMVVGNRPVELIIRDSCRRLLEVKEETQEGLSEQSGKLLELIGNLQQDYYERSVQSVARSWS